MKDKPLPLYSWQPRDKPWQPEDKTIGIYPAGDYQISIRVEQGTVCLYFEEGLILCLDAERAYNFEQTIHTARRYIDGERFSGTKTQELINSLTKMNLKKDIKKLEKMKKRWSKHGIAEP